MEEVVKMRLVINKEYPNDKLYHGYRIIFELKTKPFTIRWFVDHDEWFFYVYLGKNWWRFSSMGFLKGELYEDMD